MFRRIALVALSSLTLWACDSSSSGTNAGPLVDNTQWLPSTEGEAIFGTRPEGSTCELAPIDCEDEYPWPPGECVEFEATSNCTVAYVPECFPPAYTVLAVYTRMRDDRLSLCDWLTLEQASLRAIRAGDEVEVRAYHNELTAPVPGDARMTFVVDDQIIFDELVLIPNAAEFLTGTWTADKDYPAGTPVLWHIDNHGKNEYLLIEVNVL